MSSPDVPTGQSSALSTRFIAVAVMIVLVLVAALAGAALDRLVLRPHTEDFGRGPGGPGDRGGRGGPDGRGGFNGGRSSQGPFEANLKGDLALTDAQRTAIDSALAKQSREYDALRMTIQPRLDSLVRITREKLDSILTPAQRAAMPKFPDGFGRGRGGGRGGPDFGGPRGRRGGGPPDGDRPDGGRGGPHDDFELSHSPE